MNAIQDPEFIRLLNKWVEYADQAAAKKIQLKSNQIPAMFRTSSDVLYRGMFLSEEDIRRISENRYVLKPYTSWSSDKALAIKFTTDNQFKINRDTKGMKKVLVSKKLPQSVVFNFYSFGLFFGKNQMIEMGIDALAADSIIKEKEILVSNNVKINKTDYKII